MGFFHDDIAVDTIVELQSIDTNSDPERVQNGLYYVRETDLWYRYDLGGTPSGDDITPGDSMGAFKVGASGSGGGGTGSAIIPGYLTCQCTAPFYHTQDYSGDQAHRIGGKAIRILEEGTHSFNIKITNEMQPKIPTASDISLNSLDPAKIIEVHRWSQPPNGGGTYSAVTGQPAEPQGREWVADLPNTGGTVNVTIDSTYKWISVMARNYDSETSLSYPERDNNSYDGVYLQWFNTSDIWLWTFTPNLDLTAEINALPIYSPSAT